RQTTGYRRAQPVKPQDGYALSYDETGRMSQVDVNRDSLPDVWYTYDHRGLRTEKRWLHGTDRFVYDVSGRLLVDAPAAGPATEYIWLGARAVAVVHDAGGANALHLLATDALGMPTRAWDASTGEVSWALDHEPFGRSEVWRPKSREPPELRIGLRYPGQYEDGETGLHYNHWRYYDPNTGRYLTPDPFVAAGIPFHPFVYANSNPMRWVDSMGLYVQNNSGETIWVKPENGEWESVGPGERFDGSPDGVSTDTDKKAYYGKDWLPDNDVEVGPSGDISCVGGLCKWTPDKDWPGGDEDWVPPPDRDDRVCR
ncbi:MAG: RHS repeat-associated core domain-containing protein, partial [Pseudomonadota bacterium]